MYIVANNVRYPNIQMEKDLTYVRFIGSSLRSPENLPDLIVL